MSSKGSRSRIHTHMCGNPMIATHSPILEEKESRLRAALRNRCGKVGFRADVTRTVLMEFGAVFKMCPFDTTALYGEPKGPHPVAKILHHLLASSETIVFVGAYRGIIRNPCFWTVVRDFATIHCRPRMLRGYQLPDLTGPPAICPCTVPFLVGRVPLLQ